MEPVPSTAISFQSRRLKTLMAIRPWFFVLAFGIIGCAVTFFIERDNVQIKTRVGPLYVTQKYNLLWQDMSAETIILALISFTLFIAAIIAITFYVHRYYRCPNCETVPVGGGTRGVNLDPSICPKCGVKLR